MDDQSTNRRILLIDDTEMIHEDIRTVLAPRDNGNVSKLASNILGREHSTTPPITYEIDSAFQGKDGVEMAQKALDEGRPYALAIVDMRMPPGWDGLETIENLWKIDPDVQVVICTAYSDYSWDEMNKRLGDTDRLLILKKPFDHIEVRQLACAMTRKWDVTRQAALKRDQLESMVGDRTAELAESEQRFRALVEHAPDAILLIDAETQCFVGHNTGAEQLFGMSGDQLLETGPLDLGNADAADDQGVNPWLYLSSVLDGEARVFEWEFDKHNGDSVPCEVRINRVPCEVRLNSLPSSTGRKLIRASIVDISDRLRAAEHERERRALEDSLDALKRILGVIAHELRSPLAGTRATAEMLLASDMITSDEAQRHIKMIQHQTTHMGDMVNNLLEAARINSGVAQWNWSIVRFDEVFADARQTIEPLLDRNRVQLNFDPESLDVTMNGDHDAIRRLLLNLMNNAHTHTQQGSIDVTARSSADGDNSIELVISDTGCGIPRNIIGKLGSAFALNAGAVGDAHIGGAGLGLSICRGIVAAHGGSISVHTEENVGTTFVVKLRRDLEQPMPVRENMNPITEAAA